MTLNYINNVVSYFDINQQYDYGAKSTALVIIGVGKQYSKQTLKSNDSIVTMIFLDPISL